MRIVGHGIDLVEVPRIDRLLREHGERFLARCYTETEVLVGRGSRRYAEHLAARFAAKEATLKALATGLTGGIAWTDIEVVSLPTGEPSLRLGGHAAERAERAGVTRAVVSLTHSSSNAVASVILIDERHDAARGRWEPKSAHERRAVGGDS